MPPPMPTVLRRLILWTILCSVSAAPSFFIAREEHDDAAMIVGVCLFIAAYTLTTSTRAFARFHRRPFVRRTLYIGYGLRMILSLIVPLAMGMQAGLILLVDLWPGIVSVLLVQNVLGAEAKSFIGTLATTIVQGTLLNIIIFIIMAIVYAVQRMFMTPPPEQAPHGFEVIMPPTSVTPRARDTSAANT